MENKCNKRNKLDKSMSDESLGDNDRYDDREKNDGGNFLTKKRIQYAALCDDVLKIKNINDKSDRFKIKTSKCQTKSLYNLSTASGLMETVKETNKVQNRVDKLKHIITSYLNVDMFTNRLREESIYFPNEDKEYANLLLSFKYENIDDVQTADEFYILSKLKAPLNNKNIAQIEELITSTKISYNIMTEIIKAVKNNIKIPIKLYKDDIGIKYYNHPPNNRDFTKLIDNLKFLKRILNIYTHKIKNIKINKIITETDIKNLFEYTQHENIIVRNLITRIFEVLFLDYKEIRTIIINALKNETVKYFERDRNLRGLEIIIQLYYFIISHSDECRNILIFKQYILPLIKNSTAFIHGGETLLLFKTYSSINKILMSVMFKYFKKIFSISNTPTKNLILKIVVDVIEENITEIYPHEDEICYFINYSIKNEHHILIDAIKPLFSSSFILAQLNLISETFIKKIFLSVYRASKKYWNEKHRIKILEIIAILIFLDNYTFKECVIEYNKSQYKKKIEIKKIDENIDGDSLGADLLRNENKYKTRK